MRFFGSVMLIIMITKYAYCKEKTVVNMQSTLFRKIIDALFYLWFIFGYCCFLRDERIEWSIIVLIVAVYLIGNRIHDLYRLSKNKVNSISMIIMVEYLLEIIIGFAVVNISVYTLDGNTFCGVSYHSGYLLGIDFLLYTMELVLPCGALSIEPQNIWSRILVISETIVLYSSIIVRVVDSIRDYCLTTKATE